MAVELIANGAQPAAELWNKAFEEFDDKLTLVLADKSPFVVHYRDRATNLISPHIYLFTDDASAITWLEGFDFFDVTIDTPEFQDIGKVIAYHDVDSSLYPSTSPLWEVEVEYDRTLISVGLRTKDPFTPQTFENPIDFKAGPIAYRRRRLELAECVVENTVLTSYTIPDNADIWPVQRWHNLTKVPFTVNVGTTGTSIVIPPLSCRCLRFDTANSGNPAVVTVGYNYFNKFVAGDGRFWANGSQYNNLADPRQILKYIDQYKIDWRYQDGFTGDRRIAYGFYFENLRTLDIRDTVKDHIPGRDNPAELLNNHFYHTGKLLVARSVPAEESEDPDEESEDPDEESEDPDEESEDPDVWTFTEIDYLGPNKIEEELDAVGIDVTYNAGNMYLSQKGGDTSTVLDLICITSNIGRKVIDLTSGSHTVVTPTLSKAQTLKPNTSEETIALAPSGESLEIAFDRLTGPQAKKIMIGENSKLRIRPSGVVASDGFDVIDVPDFFKVPKVLEDVKHLTSLIEQRKLQIRSELISGGASDGSAFWSIVQDRQVRSAANGTFLTSHWINYRTDRNPELYDFNERASFQDGKIISPWLNFEDKRGGIIVPTDFVYSVPNAIGSIRVYALDAMIYERFSALSTDDFETFYVTNRAAFLDEGSPGDYRGEQSVMVPLNVEAYNEIAGAVNSMTSHIPFGLHCILQRNYTATLAFKKQDPAAVTTFFPRSYPRDYYGAYDETPVETYNDEKLTVFFGLTKLKAINFPDFIEDNENEDVISTGSASTIVIKADFEIRESVAFDNEIGLYPIPPSNDFSIPAGWPMRKELSYDIRLTKQEQVELLDSGGGSYNAFDSYDDEFGSKFWIGRAEIFSIAETFLMPIYFTDYRIPIKPELSSESVDESLDQSSDWFRGSPGNPIGELYGFKYNLFGEVLPDTEPKKSINHTGYTPSGIGIIVTDEAIFHYDPDRDDIIEKVVHKSDTNYPDFPEFTNPELIEWDDPFPLENRVPISNHRDNPEGSGILQTEAVGADITNNLGVIYRPLRIWSGAELGWTFDDNLSKNPPYTVIQFRIATVAAINLRIVSQNPVDAEYFVPPEGDDGLSPERRVFGLGLILEGTFEDEAQGWLPKNFVLDFQGPEEVDPETGIHPNQPGVIYSSAKTDLLGEGDTKVYIDEQPPDDTFHRITLIGRQFAGFVDQILVTEEGLRIATDKRDWIGWQ